MASDAMTYVKDQKLIEGKTKIIWSVKDHPDKVIIENKKAITAFDDPAYTQQFDAKARYATETTSRIFEMLEACDLPLAFVRQLSPTEFLAPKVTMISLEVVCRRLAVGSFLERRPDYCQSKRPLRFHRLVTEFFLKTSKGKINIDGEEIDPGLPQVPAKEGTKSLDDPLIVDAFAEKWQLFHPKKPGWDKAADLGVDFDPSRIKITKELLEKMELINRKAFLIIEAFWANQGFVLVDWKIEFGITTQGELVIADVIDNDSWRLRDPEFKEVSKQVFRDGGKLDEVASKYGYVANMVSQFRLPNQALVIWKGSPNDKSPEVPEIPGINKVEVVLSGHKKTQACLAKLEELQRDYPDGGVILAIVGMSNGLGPVLSSHTSWPVIGIPITVKELPEDIWSSLRLPSENPMVTILSEKNAVLSALNILGQKNPAAYMFRQIAIEQLDAGY
ncbi:MAG: AIR carboxylase family protein [Candidatus Parcubacteria bacterium]|nr:AIR carboxylase family protein [Candidatus Parcubacteria bacterium]